ncbi:MAG: PEGA domain-containing protein [Candidatus Levybacteria bacterium]|nr:PEGA domain-containing protein [Candidatus Levybacteria bacterium]
MKKLFAVLLLFILIGVGSAWYFLYFKKNVEKGALQVTAFPKSKVYINGELVGETPLCRCEAKDMLSAGEYKVKIVPQEGGFAPFEEKVTIVRSVLTVLDRAFGQGAESQGHTITLRPISDNKNPELFITSFPQGAEVLIDKNVSGKTPRLLENITESDHEVVLRRKGYKEKTIRIRTVPGYQLSIIAYMGIDTLAAFPIASVAAEATSSAKPTPVAQVEVLDTPTGYLNVRKNASTTSKKIGTVTPSDILELLSEEEGWFHVKLPDGTEGFVSAQYAKKKE